MRYSGETSALWRGFQINKEGESRKYRIGTVSSGEGGGTLFTALVLSPGKHGL